MMKFNDEILTKTLARPLCVEISFQSFQNLMRLFTEFLVVEVYFLVLF